MQQNGMGRTFWAQAVAWMLLALPASSLVASTCPEPIVDLNDYVETRYGSPDPTLPPPGEGFGNAVAIHGAWMVVGAPLDDGELNNLMDSGAAYVYERIQGAWVFRQRLEASDGATSDSFGFAVDIFEDWIIIGSPQSDPLGQASGSAYVFPKKGQTGHVY